MGLPSFDACLPEDFSGEVRLFPLPNLVLFPSVVQALHIFEPRYCDMLEEALEGDQLITMALLRPGWEAKYMGSPSLADVVCIGKILTHSPAADDRHNILIAGVKRARLIREIPSNAPFRRGHVELLEDVYPPEGNDERRENRAELIELIDHVFGKQAKETFGQLVSKQIPLGTLTDIIAFGSRLPIDKKQELLQQTNVDDRCRVLLQHLRQLRQFESSNPSSVPPPIDLPESRFPPKFSDN